MGTLENMSPEQAESSKDVDERADVYALGTILFQMLTGRRHFEASGNIVADAQALQTHEPPRPRSLNPKLDSDLDIILLKALRNSPLHRYRSVHALQADLERYRRGEVIRARPVSAFELLRKVILRNRAIAVVITISLLIFIAGSIAAFWKISERAKAAETALTEAKRQEHLAIQSELLAQEQKRQALAAQERAEEELDARLRAESALSIAENDRSTALQETEQERKKREASEVDARRRIAALTEETQKQIEEIRASQQAQPSGPELPFPQRPPVQEDPVAFEKWSRVTQDATMQFLHELSPPELTRYERNPEIVLGRIGDALGNLSEVLLADPTFTPAWLLKGRYHLACMEVTQARESFNAAAKSSAIRREQSRPDFPGQDDPAALAALCAEILKPSNDRAKKTAALLNATGNPMDQTTAGAVALFDDTSIARKSTLASRPMDRQPGQSEIALNLILLNGGVGRVTVQEGSHGGRELSIIGIDQLADLSPLKKMTPPPTKIRIEGASSLDWAGLGLVSLESLDLSGCPLPAIPPTARLQRLQTLVIKDTALSDLAFVRQLPMLSHLDISGTRITDLSPLANCRRLLTLDVSRLPLDNLRTLTLLPLRQLTISPMMVSEKSSLAPLRFIKNLKTLRSPDDPADQPAAAFWKKLDSGGYDSQR